MMEQNKKMDRDTQTVKQHLVSQWKEFNAALSKMHNTATVKPSDGLKIFSAVDSQDANIIKFELLPVVFNLPERADHPNPKLYIVVSGLLEIDRNEFDKKGVLLTQNFSTKVAYFRRTKDSMDHVYGAHFDLALDELGHPTFHMQLRSFMELKEYVNREYPFDIETKDTFGKVLRNVRLPTAQMDIFSLFIQIFADHLLFKNAGKEERAIFNSLVGKNSFLKGAGFKSNRLSAEGTQLCYRAQHWYPLLT